MLNLLKMIQILKDATKSLDKECVISMENLEFILENLKELKEYKEIGTLDEVQDMAAKEIAMEVVDIHVDELTTPPLKG